MTSTSANSGTSIQKLKFEPRARIIRTIGDQLISGPEAAVIELVKNAYDADASRVTIKFFPPLTSGSGRLTVQDDGHGMTLSDIQEKWMEPATSAKVRVRRSPKRHRTMMGSKGIGRFAAAKLGAKLMVRSVSDRLDPSEAIIVGEIDWSIFNEDTYLSDIEIDYLTQPTSDPTGTELEIRELNENWPAEKLERLLHELRRLISPLEASGRDDSFRIFLDLSACTRESVGFDGASLVEGVRSDEPSLEIDYEPFEVVPFPLLTVCDYEVSGRFAENGKFSGTMQLRRAGQPPQNIELMVPVDPDEIECGPVEVRFFIFDREADAIKSNMAEAGLGQLSATEARRILDNTTGIAVYRDGFRVRPYGDVEHDWLALDTRRVNDPTLRIGRNQIAGYLIIGGSGSENLIEKSSREGFEDNGAYRRLRRLALELLAQRVEAKRYDFRQKAGISRKRSTTHDEVRRLAELRKLRAFAERLPADERSEALGIIDEEAASLAERINDLEERHRLLEARSSLGAILAEVLHEGEPPVGYIVTTSKRLQRLWAELSSQLHFDHPSAQEFPKKLAYLKQNGDRLASLFKALRPLAGSRRNRQPDIFFPMEAIGQAADLFSAHSVEFVYENKAVDARVIGYPEDLATATVNLFKNSIYWLENSHAENPLIKISIKSTVDKVLVDIEDNGPGIPSEFVDHIFDVGFTLRDGGTGLGLNIAKEALSRSKASLVHDNEYEHGTRFTVILDRYMP